MPSFQHFADCFTKDVWHAVPDNWDLLCLRIKSSEAYTTRLSEDIGSAAIATIVAARNALPGLSLPAWVHEAGCTFLAPSSEREALIAVLSDVRQMATSVFTLNAQTSIIPVSALGSEKGTLEIGRYAPSNTISWPTLRGTALLSFESILQSGDYMVPDTTKPSSSFHGYRERWQPIHSKHGRIVSIVVRALRDDLDAHAQVYKRVLAEVSLLTQVTDGGCPLSSDSLVPLSAKHDYSTEVQIRGCSAGSEGSQAIRREIQAQRRAASSWRERLGLTKASKHNNKSTDNLIVASDFMSFCGSLRMNLDLRHGQLRRLREILQVAEDHGHLLYGIHTSASSIVRAIAVGDDAPVYIIHGSAGGFELASRRIEARLRDLHIDESV